ncbi:MAG: family 43 glycosylhydrolase, partial [Clostridia bacterium]|nr:family 43 glycosylhydrolase [Clostridia bacterium]
MGAVFVSDTPVGPFYLANSEEGRFFDGNPDMNGKILTKMSPQINIYGYFHNNATKGYEGLYLQEEFPIIDISPIYTSSDELYITFVKHRSDNHPHLINDPTNPKSEDGTNCVWMMKMKSDWVTPDYETLTKIAEVDYKSVIRNEEFPCWDEENGYILDGYFKENEDTWERYNDGQSNGEGNINEGPQLFEKDGRFYLCYSPRGYASRLYDVKQAISDTGIYGPYTKLPSDYARVFGTTLAKNDPEIGMTGTGHHAFVEAGDELFCVYYVHSDPQDGSVSTYDGRIYAVDRLDFVNVDGYGTLIYGDGATNTLQFKPNVTTGLRNVMLDDGVSIKATRSDENTIKYLNDNKIIAQDVHKAMQFSCSERTEIVITFDTPKEICALQVFNAYEYEYGFGSIDGAIFDLAEKPFWYPDDVEYVNKAYIKGIG